MKPTYRVKDWEKHFENHESRKVKKAYWVAIPNRHDGKSYRRIAAHPDGVAVFAGWILILEAASKMPERGVLADEDGPLDADDLASMTGFPAAIFEAAFRVLPEEKIGWLSAEEPKTRRRRSSGSSRDLPQSPATSRHLPESPGAPRNRPDSPATPGSSAVELQDMELQDMELQDTEGNDRERHSANAGASATAERQQQDFDIWKLGVGKLMATGTPEQDARSLLGKMRKDHGSDVVSEAITKMLATNPVDPKAYLLGVLRGRNGTAKSKVDQSLAAAERVAAKYEQRS